MKRRFWLIFVVSAGIHLALLSIRFQHSGSVVSGKPNLVVLVAGDHANFISVETRFKDKPVAKIYSLSRPQAPSQAQVVSSRLQAVPRKVSVPILSKRSEADVPERRNSKAQAQAQEQPELVELARVPALSHPPAREAAIGTVKNSDESQGNSLSLAKRELRTEAGVRPLVSLIHAVPRYADNPRPEYPEVARRKGWAGEVQLLVRVADTGGVDRISVHRSSGYSALDRAARRAVRLWRFVPATEAGRKVPSEVLIPIDFRLPASGETSVSTQE